MLADREQAGLSRSSLGQTARKRETTNRELMLRGIKAFAKCACIFIVLTMICTVIWEEFVIGNLYNCTDPGFLEYLTPGDWVHRRPVAVDHIVSGRPMSEPDTIKRGWTVSGLWGLWYSMVGASIFVSVWFSFVPLTRKDA